MGIGLNNRDKKTLNPWVGYEQATERDANFAAVRNNWQAYWNGYRSVFPNRLKNNATQETGQTNFLKIVTKTINWFLFGLKGVNIKLISEGKVDDVQEKLEKVLSANNFRDFCIEAVNSMLIFGDAFTQVGWEEADDSNEFFRKVNNIDTNGVCKLKVFDNFIVYPVVKERDITKIDYYIITNITNSTNQYDPIIEIYRPDVIEVYHDNRITRPKFIVKNPINGDLPITHLVNNGNPQSFYGISEFEDLYPINTEYVVKNDVFSEAVDRASLPPTIIKGAKKKGNIIFGINEVIQGLRPEASIEYLKFDNNLEPLREYLKEAEEKFYTIAGIPKIARGEETKISNTSSAAMKVLYYPLILRAGLKRPSIDRFITDIIWKILMFMEAKGELEIPKNLRVLLTYPNPFPKDVNSLITEISLRTDLEAITKRQILELLEVEHEDIDEILKKYGEELAPQSVVTQQKSNQSEISRELASESVMGQSQNSKEGQVV